MIDKKLVVSTYALPVALALLCAALTVLCLWIAAALLQFDGAGPIAFGCVSGALFWGAGACLAVMYGINRRNRAESEARRAALLTQLRMARRAA